MAPAHQSPEPPWLEVAKKDDPRPEAAPKRRVVEGSSCEKYDMEEPVAARSGADGGR